MKKMYKKEWNTDKHATTWVDFENMLCVRSQSPKITLGGMTATEHSISFWRDENVLKLCKELYNSVNTLKMIKSYTLNG